MNHSPKFEGRGRSFLRSVVGCMVAVGGSALAQEGVLERGAQRSALDAASPFADWAWTCVGPRYCGGRIESIAVDPRDAARMFVAPGSGSLWRTDDGGRTWQAQFEHEATCAIGDVTLDPSQPEVVWVGTGEAHLGGMSYDGCGVYRSTDGGATWEHRGLGHVRRIGKVRVHPEHSDVVWVAAIGSHRGGSRTDDRGVFRTEDGGETWTQVLAPGVAVIDLVVDAANPDRLFATTWDRDGGDRSGVHRSLDGGLTWKRLGGGLPTRDDLERVAVDLCRDEPNVVVALFVDGSKPGGGRYGVGGVVYRSNDGGESWTRCHEEFLSTYVGWDFCDVKVAPDDPDRLFVCGMKMLHSSDGGATWAEAGESIRRLLPFEVQGFDVDEVLHLDVHDLWISPEDSKHLRLGTDGGLYESHDGGESWLHLNTLPIAEFYLVHVDDAEPYRIWGGTQDNASVVGVPVPVAESASDADTWRPVFLDKWAGGDGFATLPDPTDPNVVYFEHQNGDMRRKRIDGSVLSGAADDRIRPRGRELEFAWSTPLLVSAHEPATLYCASQHVHRSDDRGTTWTRIGDDLGKGRPLVTLSESPRNAGHLAASSSAGPVHWTEDGGTTWTPAAKLPGSVRRVTVSRFAEQRLYACCSARRGSARLFRSEDGGAEWVALDEGLPADHANVLLEDPRFERVLYLGTDAAVYVSRDGGATWASLSATLPTIPVLDLAMQPREGALIAATHGRSLFTLDVRELRPEESPR